MEEMVLKAWESRWVTVTALGEGSHTERRTGRIGRVGSDGFTFQPSDSPRHTEALPRPIFLPWHAIRSVTFEPQS
jgi:hypothetical protein